MKILIKILTALTLFIIIFIVTTYVSYRLFTDSHTITVPELKGKSFFEASEILSSLKLYLIKEGEAYNTDIPSGHIIKQSTPPGNKTKEGRTIRVVVSKGPQIQYMPEFTELTIREAEELALLKKLELKTVIRVGSGDVERDIVLSQKPAHDEEGSKELTLLVSSGIYKIHYYCPNFIEKTVDEAKKLATALGIELEIKERGVKVTGQEPPPGAVIRKGSIVRLKMQQPETEQYKEEESTDRWFL